MENDNGTWKAEVGTRSWVTEEAWTLKNWNRCRRPSVLRSSIIIFLLPRFRVPRLIGDSEIVCGMAV